MALIGAIGVILFQALAAAGTADQIARPRLYRTFRRAPLPVLRAAGRLPRTPVVLATQTRAVAETQYCRYHCCIQPALRFAQIAWVNRETLHQMFAGSGALRSQLVEIQGDANSTAARRRRVAEVADRP